MELKVGLEYTYKPINQRVRIVWENISAGGVNFADALVCVETLKGFNQFTMPAALAERYLTEEPPVRARKGIPANKL